MDHNLPNLQRPSCCKGNTEMMARHTEAKLQGKAKKKNYLIICKFYVNYSENESSRLTIIINIAYSIYAWKRHTFGTKERNEKSIRDKLGQE